MMSKLQLSCADSYKLLFFRICLLLCTEVGLQRSHSCWEIEKENIGEGKRKGRRVRDTMRERKWKCMWVSVLGLWGRDRLALVCAAFSTGPVPGPGREVTEGMAALLTSACCLPFKENQCLGGWNGRVNVGLLPDFGKQSDLVTAENLTPLSRRSYTFFF